jgi:polyferredoxin
MHGQIAIGISTSLVNIAIHALIMAAVTRVFHHTSRATERAGARSRLVVVMMATVTVLTAAHLVEIGVWGAVYAIIDAVPQEGDAFYFAFVNYTTLGYGDILPVAYWRLLGPMAAMNGILLFGWSAAVIFDVLRTITQAETGKQERADRIAAGS